MASSAMRKGTFSGANVFLSRSLVAPEVFDALHDALRLNGAQVFLCCDPSRSSPNDYHVISSPDHEKFEDLRVKGCNLLGPQCILSCAKECRILPKQGYTCCLAMDGVKVLASGFEKEDKVKIEQLVTAMGGALHSKASLDINFVVVKNVLAAKYKWAFNVLKKPIVNMSWLTQCWTEHRIVPQEPYRILPFTGLNICVTRIPADERKEMEKLIVQNGGHYSADLTKKCTHLVSDVKSAYMGHKPLENSLGNVASVEKRGFFTVHATFAPVGDKYMVARRWGHIHIVTRRWVDQSIARKACLDEGLYPVHGNSVSHNEVKGSQKEQKYQDHSTATSQPIPPTMIEDPEATLSQNISSSFSDATKVNNEGTDSPALEMKDEAKFESHIAEDSETEDNDLYLSDCRIFLVGFEERELSKLVAMIRKGGGSRHMLLSEKLTHIIIGVPSEVEKKEVRRLAAWGVINMVKSAWLEECDRAKKELPVSPRHIASELLFPKDSTCIRVEPSTNACGIKKVKSFVSVPHVPVVHVSEDKNFEAELLLGRKKGKDMTENGLGGSSSVELATKSGQSNHLHASNSVNKDRCRSSSGTMDVQNIKASNIFRGRTFCFSTLFPQDRRAQIIEWIKQGGGVIVDNQHRMKVHFIIECHGVLQIPPDVSESTVVSTHWIRCCLEEGCLQDVGGHIIYSPLRCHIPLPGFESLRFCISQYEAKDRLLLRNLCFTLGAKFTEKLTKKVTHLLCKFTSGPKYEAACNWGIQSVTADWITECIKQDTIVALDPFLPKPATSQDREAGLCTISQYPTQAACMVSGVVPSQLLSESQGAVDNSKQNSGIMNDSLCEEPEHLSTFGKRSRLSECTTSIDASKKHKVPENLLVGSNAVPDVADAIEDLLAQSAKIQDMRSPGRSGCDRSIYSHDHTILGQDNENSHSTFGISRHWLSRPQKQDTVPNTTVHDGNTGAYDAFSETQTESQVVGYEEDLSGRQKIIDRVRSQSMTLTQDRGNEF